MSASPPHASAVSASAAPSRAASASALALSASQRSPTGGAELDDRRTHVERSRLGVLAVERLDGRLMRWSIQQTLFWTYASSYRSLT